MHMEYDDLWIEGEDFRSFELAADRLEDWRNEVSYQYDCGVISLATLKMAYRLSPYFLWDCVNEHGAPLYATHERVLEKVGVSRSTLNRAREDLIVSGLITVVKGKWHAAVNGGGER